MGGMFHLAGEGVNGKKGLSRQIHRGDAIEEAKARVAPTGGARIETELSRK